MHATLHQFRLPLGTAGAEFGDGAVGAGTLTQVAGLTGAVLTFWPDAARAAEAAARRPAGTTWLDVGVYRVAEVQSASDAAAFAQITWFDGPRSADQSAAEMRAGRERVWPAVRDLDGIGTTYVLLAEDRALVVVSFAASIDAIEATQRAISATELLPGEDPALLPGPDRVDLHRVRSADLPAPAGAR
ncbi:hypothetical protein M8542_32605 [Amycolatopsis sp. OK19-0408]|uniref:Uncharacterized protein n=1 Tax=Amycolatopsis iheyensis TaxID=2945988 RepID=A0A9X2NJB7_9PSEU|nr:hypothetical protein [Amycolatopsis iheyensis]MCR6487579.1 hypothetical protein [Amycolatopsis iheyensis]